MTVQSGLRAQELIALKIYKKSQPLEGGIDFENNIIHVRKALKRGRTRDVSSAAEGDALATGGVDYTIRDVIGDGTGMITLMLEAD